MRPIAIIVLMFGWLCWAGPIVADTESEITAALDYFAEVWDAGDLESIRSYYDPDFVLVTSSGLVSRADRMADLQSITQSEGDRGELSYSGVQVLTLADGHALAYGQRTLAFKDGSSITTWFSTVYKKTPFGWKAILSHQ
jgi:hypothetical protein